MSDLVGSTLGPYRILVTPIEDFANQMSAGLSCFEQFVWDLEQRGVSNIDIPVLIMGIAE